MTFWDRAVLAGWLVGGFACGIVHAMLEGRRLARRLGQVFADRVVDGPYVRKTCFFWYVALGVLVALRWVIFK